MKNRLFLTILISASLLLTACSNNGRNTQSNVVVDQFSHQHGNLVHYHQNPKQSHSSEDNIVNKNEPTKAVIYVESVSKESHRSLGFNHNKAAKTRALTASKPCELDSVIPNKPLDPNCIDPNKTNKTNPINLIDPTNPIRPNKPNILDPIRPNVPIEPKE